MGKKSKRKGKRGEREFCKAFEEAIPFGTARRSQQFAGQKVPGAADVQTSMDKYVRFEVKRYKNNVRTYSKQMAYWLDKLEDETSEDLTPMLAFRNNRAKWELICRLPNGVIVRTQFKYENLHELLELYESFYL